MSVGSKVLYHGKESTILFMYNNGYCEIKMTTECKIELVHFSELTVADC